MQFRVNENVYRELAPRSASFLDHSAFPLRMEVIKFSSRVNGECTSRYYAGMTVSSMYKALLGVSSPLITVTVKQAIGLVLSFD